MQRNRAKGLTRGKAGVRGMVSGIGLRQRDYYGEATALPRKVVNSSSDYSKMIHVLFFGSLPYEDTESFPLQPKVI